MSIHANERENSSAPLFTWEDFDAINQAAHVFVLDRGAPVDAGEYVRDPVELYEHLLAIMDRIADTLPRPRQ